MKQKSLVSAVALNMLGTIIGAGVFGLPQVFAKTGVIGGTLLFFAILALSLCLHLLFVDVIAANHSSHKIPGYAEKYLGVWIGRLAAVNVYLKSAGTILAYIILGGDFLWVIAKGLGLGGEAWFWSIVFWAIGSVIVVFRLKLVSAIEKELTILLIGFMIFAVIVVLPFLDWSLLDIKLGDGLVNAIGVIFFATTGLSVLPDIALIAGKDVRQARFGIIWGTLLAGVLSWFFGMAMMMAFPTIATVKDLYLAMPAIFWWLIPSVGILAIITSFLTMAQSQKNMLHVDYKWPWSWAWIAAVVAPLLAYLTLSQSFVGTIGFVGAVFTAINGIVVALCAYLVLSDGDAKESWLRKALNIKTKKKTKVFWMWRYLPIPIIAVLVFIMVQHLVGL